MKTGRLLGSPYNSRPLTSERLRQRAWNPQNYHILIPKSVQLGCSINFYEVARKLHGSAVACDCLSHRVNSGSAHR